VSYWRLWPLFFYCLFFSIYRTRRRSIGSCNYYVLLFSCCRCRLLYLLLQVLYGCSSEHNERTRTQIACVELTDRQTDRPVWLHGHGLVVGGTWTSEQRLHQLIASLIGLLRSASHLTQLPPPAPPLCHPHEYEWALLNAVSIRVSMLRRRRLQRLQIRHRWPLSQDADAITQIAKNGRFSSTQQFSGWC